MRGLFRRIAFFAALLFPAVPSAGEPLIRILGCRGVAQWDGIDHDLSVNVFQPETGYRYTTPFYHTDDASSTYADQLTMYSHFEGTFKSGSSSQIIEGNVWLAVPLEQKSSRLWRFRANPPFRLHEKPVYVDVSLDTKTLTGKMTYKYWMGYLPFLSPSLGFRSDLKCEVKESRIELSELSASKPLYSVLK